MAIQHGGSPSRLNVVSFLFLAAAVAGIYWLVQFGPAYYRRWQASSAAAELTNRLYANRLRSGEGESAVLDEIRQELNARLRQIGIDETTAQISFQKNSAMAQVTVSYREVVRHPLVNKSTTLDFTIVEQARQGAE